VGLEAMDDGVKGWGVCSGASNLTNLNVGIKVVDHKTENLI